MYDVVKPFFDLQDNNTQYAPQGTKSPYAKEGEEVHASFPRPGLEPTEERIAELSGKENKRGVTLIKPAKKTKKKEG